MSTALLESPLPLAVPPGESKRVPVPPVDDMVPMLSQTNTSCCNNYVPAPYCSAVNAARPPPSISRDSRRSSTPRYDRCCAPTGNSLHQSSAATFHATADIFFLGEKGSPCSIQIAMASTQSVSTSAPRQRWRSGFFRGRGRRFKTCTHGARVYVCLFFRARCLPSGFRHFFGQTRN